MPRLFMLTLGFHENFAIRRLVSHSATRGDRVVCLTLKPAAGATLHAFEGIRAFTARMGVEEPVLVELPGDDIAEASLTVKRIACGSDLYVVADLTGGPKSVSIATLLGLVMSDVEGEVWVQVEGGPGGEDRIPLGVLRALRTGVSGEKRSILRLVSESPGITPDEIAVELGVSRKTVLNHLAALRRLGLVYRRGRGGGVYPTKWGVLFT